MPRKPRGQAQSAAHPPPVRRSTRIASSRASSVSAPDPQPDGTHAVEDGWSSFDYLQYPHHATPRPVEEEEEPISIDINKHKKNERKRTTSEDSLDPANVPLSYQLEAAAANEPPFDVGHAVAEVLLDRAHVHLLTLAQKDAVIKRLADQEAERRRQLEELERRNEELQRERDEALQKAASLKKNSFRNKLLMENVEKRKQEEAELAKAEAAKQTPAAQPSASKNTPSTEKQPETMVSARNRSPKASTTSASTTPPDNATATPTPQQNATPALSKSFLGRLMGSFSSPFTPRIKSTSKPQAPPQQAAIEQQEPVSQTPQQSQEPLGELPASRKRRAVSEEPDVDDSASPAPQRASVSFTEQPTYTPRTRNIASNASSNNTPRRPHTVQPTRTRFQETPMTTISEHSENSELADNTFSVPEPTPSQPKPRTVRAARLHLQQRQASKTPGRFWQTPAERPREPNADVRMEKLRQYRKLDLQLKDLKRDPEIQMMVMRPVKRVKVDDLAWIPHHRPGESSGTFRLPEVDSDGEMEVDEEEEEDASYNMFGKDGNKTATAPAVDSAAKAQPTPAQPAPQAFQPAPQPAPAPVQPEVVDEVAATVYDWPDEGRRENADEEYQFDAIAGAKFTYGFETWRATGISAVSW